MDSKQPLERTVDIAGIEGCASIQLLLENWYKGKTISLYEKNLASTIATVLTGGQLNANTTVTEAWFYQLEHDAFIQLLQLPEAKEKIIHLLKTGKPLRV